MRKRASKTIVYVFRRSAVVEIVGFRAPDFAER